MSIFKKVGRWAKRRATEGTTIAGVGVIVGGLIAPKLGLPIDQTTQIVTSILGGLLAGATSANHTPVAEQG